MVLGPGGSGVSVLAAAGALDLAEASRATRRADGAGATRPSWASVGSTLLVTVDPRSPLPRLLGVFRVPGEAVSVTAELDLLTLDRLAVTESAWIDFTAALNSAGAVGNLLPVVGTIAGIDAGELAGLPGAQEFLLLRAVREAATSGRWQRIVVDLSGAGDPYELLRAPTVLATAISRLWPRHRRLAEALEKPALAPLAGAVEGIARDCEDLGELFADPHAVAAHLVLPGGERGVEALGDHAALVDLMGLPLRSVLVDAGPGLLPTDPVTAAARRVFGAEAGSAVSVLAIDGADAAPSRLSQLRRLDVRLPAPNGRPRGAAAANVVDLGGEGLAARYRLSWRQRLADPERLALGRSGDDLLVTVSGFRHPVRLPSVLRRCRVTGADWDGESLQVDFAPDPAVWPQR
ncbi:ArsA family ATPase [Gordonia iterans]